MEFDDKKKKVNKLITPENTNIVNGIEMISNNDSKQVDRRLHEEATKLNDEDLDDMPDLD